MNATPGHTHVPQPHIHGQGQPAIGPEVARSE
jgi:hypothetical protein